MADEEKHKELVDLCNGLWNRNSLKSVKEWLEENEDNVDLLKEAASYTDKENSTALHYLLKVSPSSDVVVRLLQVAPDTISIPNDRGSFPLHVACNHNASPDVIEVLIEAYPEAATLQNYSGDLPLHICCDYACCTPKSTDAVRS
jgi:ankyrin repeat protein